jgi:CBS domain containing-hemolysin-like protein
MLALILANAYFVATEFALVALRRSELEVSPEAMSRRAAAVLRAQTHLDDSIAACQLGITLSSIGVGWLGEPALASALRPLLALFDIASPAATHTIAIALAFALVTFLHVVLGELAPKALALSRPARVALRCALPLAAFARAFGPLLRGMNGAANAIVRLFGVTPGGAEDRALSEEELHFLVDEARDAGLIRPYTSQILGNVFDTGHTTVRQVMVERAAVFSVARDISNEALLDAVRESGFSRIPVRDGAGSNSLDRIVGILHAKDLFHVYAKFGAVILADALRPAVEISPDLAAMDALRKFRRTRKHLALVREPGGPLLGVVTLEDILEEIVGEIEDEHDVPTAAAGA